MKKRIFLFSVIALVLGTVSANAQVKFGFGLGYVMPTGGIADFTDGGISGNLELGYGVTDNMDASVYYQADVLIGGDYEGLSVGTVVMNTFMLNGRYYFMKEGFRPYGSLGLGITSIGSVSFDASNDDDEIIKSGSNFSFRPALGFKYKVLNFNVAYLNAGKVEKASMGSFSINLGLLFTFGGKK